MAGLGHDHVGAFVLETAQRGVLLRRGGGVEGVHFHDPAEAVGLVRVGGVTGVEAGIVQLPLARRGRRRQAVALVGRGRARGDKVAVEVLLAGQDGAPRGGAAGAVAQRSFDGPAGGIVDCLHQGGARDRSGQLVDRAVQVAAVQPRTLDVAPRLVLVLPLQFDHGQPVRGSPHCTDLGGRHGGREHDVLVGVFVVGEEHRAAALAARNLEDVRVVVVVAELLLLRGRRLAVDIERRGVLEDRVTPADHGLPGEPGRHGQRVHVRGDGRDRGELQLGLAEAVLRCGGEAGAAVGHCRSGRRCCTAEHDGERTGGAEAEGGAAGHGGGGDVAEVAVGAGVADLARAGVVALQRAGDGAPLAFGVAKHGQQGKLASGRFRHGGPSKESDGVPPTLPAGSNAQPSAG